MNIIVKENIELKEEIKNIKFLLENKRINDGIHKNKESSHNSISEKSSDTEKEYNRLSESKENLANPDKNVLKKTK